MDVVPDYTPPSPSPSHSARAQWGSSAGEASNSGCFSGYRVTETENLDVFEPRWP